MDADIQSANPTKTGLPVMLMALTMVIWFSFQLFQSLKAKDALEQAFKAQEQPVESADKIRKSLSALAMATKQLAKQGNPNATLVVNNLAARGINIADPQGQEAKP